MRRPRSSRRGCCPRLAYAATVVLAAAAVLSLALALALLLLPPQNTGPAPAPGAPLPPALALRGGVRRSAWLHARIMSFNIRNIHNASTASGTLDWASRARAVAAAIAAAAPDAVGLQEASREQLSDLLALLPGFAVVAHGRRGRNVSETAAVLYDARALRLLAARTFWLSETPGVEGSIARAWGSQLPRVATMATLQPLRRRAAAAAAGAGARGPYGATPFHIINTHLDHEGAAARLHGAELVLAAAAAAAAGGGGAGAGLGVVEDLPPLPHPLLGAPCFVTGDFNSGPADAPAAALTQALFVDALAALGGGMHAGTGTFHNFTGAALRGVPRIDYVLASRPPAASGCRLRGDAWVDALPRLGQWPSDHFPVVADVHYVDADGAVCGGW